jgi:hypothetical protein
MAHTGRFREGHLLGLYGVHPLLGRLSVGRGEEVGLLVLVLFNACRDTYIHVSVNL